MDSPEAMKAQLQQAATRRKNLALALATWLMRSEDSPAQLQDLRKAAAFNPARPSYLDPGKIPDQMPNQGSQAWSDLRENLRRTLEQVIEDVPRGYLVVAENDLHQVWTAVMRYLDPFETNL